MEDIYRGDTFKFDIAAELEEGIPYTFQKGDIIKVGMKASLAQSKCNLFKKIVVEEATDTIPVAFSHEEMMKCCEGIKLLEAELTDTEGNVKTLFQEKVKIVGDLINE